jgi:hypothetical protein
MGITLHVRQSVVSSLRADYQNSRMGGRQAWWRGGNNLKEGAFTF